MQIQSYCLVLAILLGLPRQYLSGRRGSWRGPSAHRLCELQCRRVAVADDASAICGEPYT